MADAFGEALLDHHRDEREASLFQRDGDEVLCHPVEDFYFGSFESEPDSGWVASWLDGPLLDVGAGSGRDALYFQRQFGTVALEISHSLVTLLDERGVRRVRQGDLFALRDQFDRDRFRSVLALGTQVGLAKSMQGLTDLLGEFAYVTDADGTAVLDCYDPTHDGATEMLGFRPDPSPGLARRVVRYEYGDLIGDTLLFLLFSPDRLREATRGTEWAVADIRRPHGTYHYRAALQK